MPVVAGVDSSTQSTTVSLHDADTGALLGTGRAPHPRTYPPISEQDPTAWWEALTTALRIAREHAGVQPADIAAISVAAQCHGLVPLGEDDQVLRPAKLWNDTTAASQSRTLRAELSADEWVHRVGSVPPPAFTISKLAWLRDEEPDTFARLRRIALPHEWLNLQLTGRLASDRSDASGTGYYSASRGRYDFEVLGLIDGSRPWESMLADVLGPGEPAGTVSTSIAEELGIAGGAVVGCGAGDQHASAVGLGVLPGDTVFVFGTSGVVYGRSTHEVYDQHGEVNSVADAMGAYLPLVCTLNAAKVTDTIAQLLGVDHATLTALALAAPRSAGRPVFAAYLDGERSPDRPGAQGILAGLTTATTRESLALAAFEGVVFGLERGRRQLERVGVATGGDIIATGGGAASTAYLQTLADTTGQDVVTIDESQPVAKGMAIQAAALITGASLEAVRDSWAPARSVATHPSTPVQRDILDRYLTLSSWEGLDA